MPSLLMFSLLECPLSCVMVMVVATICFVLFHFLSFFSSYYCLLSFFLLLLPFYLLSSSSSSFLSSLSLSSFSFTILSSCYCISLIFLLLGRDLFASVERWRLFACRRPSDLCLAGPSLCLSDPVLSAGSFSVWSVCLFGRPSTCGRLCPSATVAGCPWPCVYRSPDCPSGPIAVPSLRLADSAVVGCRL